MSKKIYIGNNPVAGSDGRSAYQVWLDQGNVGTEADFLASLKGEQGNSGYSGAAGELEVVNNLTDGGATAALSAQQGVVLAGQVSQLGQEVNNLNSGIYGGEVVKSLVWSDGYITTSGVVSTSAYSKYTQPFLLKKGQRVTVSTANSNVCIIGTTTAQSLSIGDSITVLQKTNSGNYETHTYTAKQDIKLVLCVTWSNYSLEFEQVEYLEGEVEVIGQEAVQINPQTFTDSEQEQARINIFAQKQAYSEIGFSGLYEAFTSVLGNRAKTTSKILSMYNIFDKDHLVEGKRRNDSGTVVNDPAAGYTDNYIPIYGGVKITANVYIQNTYLFDYNGDFVKRYISLNVGNVLEVPNTAEGKAVGFIQFQFRLSDITDLGGKGNVMISMRKLQSIPVVSGDYVPFSLQNGGIITEDSFVYNDGWSDGVIYVQIELKGDDIADKISNSALFTDISPWEPSSADSGYSNPTTGYGDDTYRADWTAVDKYLYYEFLEHYYDTYLGSHDNGDYFVSKRGLWQDSAETGHEIFEYDFCPKDYKYTIMLSAGMNADETQGIWGLATFIRCLMNDEEPQLAAARKVIRFKVIPILNASGFDQARLRYTFPDGVNPNFNFNYKDSWSQHDVSLAAKGEYPDSHVETKGLKKWVNDHSNIAFLWLDIHTGRFPNSYPGKNIVDIRWSETSDYYGSFNSNDRLLIKDFYVDKGYIVSTDDIGWAVSARTDLAYQKHRYATDICGIHSAQMEMHIESVAYGADGNTNNTTYGIKCYVLLIRQTIMWATNKYISEHSLDSLPKIAEMRYRGKFL